MGNSVGARPLVNGQHPPHELGISLGESLTDIEDTISIEGLVAVEQDGAGFNLRLGHVRIETRPSIDLPGCQGPVTIRVLKEYGVDVVLSEAFRVKRAQ